MNKNFGRVLEVMTEGMKFSMSDYNIEGVVTFDNDPLPNEAEIKIWNLSDKTLNNIKTNKVLMINAGYKGDVGVILHGYVSHVSTAWSGVDKITTIKVLDGYDLSKRQVKEIAFAKGTLGSQIIKQMAVYIGLPIAQMDLNQDYRYQDGYSAKGAVTEIISKVCKDCATSCYINKGKLYVRSLRRGADNRFALNSDTGLIGSPAPFEQSGVKGYNLSSQLQYRITTASAIDLKSRAWTGRLYVRSGSHTFTRTGDFKTDMEAIM
ncbi:phage protein [Paenibacillus sp. FSL K6-1558]|uniref:phage protein n=1 Tax=Paenibacillus sp. FSL K6-1558 TaxID=2921473 RepID=UPI0030F7DBA2